MAEYVDIALNLPVDRLFTYSVPPALRHRIQPGTRLLVPFQSRQIGGTCVSLREDAPAFKVRPVLSLIDPEPLFTTSMLRLAGWVARRYGATWGESLDAALPFAVRTGGRLRTVPVARLAVPLDAVDEIVEKLEQRYPKQARTLRILAAAEAPLEVQELQRRAKVKASPVESLRKKGYLEISRVQKERDPLFSAPAAREPDRVLTGPQKEAVRELREAIHSGRSRGFVLFGVTGSGKTEVYLQALETVVRKGRQGIVLVPEIALTPQTVARFRARFERVAVLHSHLTDADRNAQWKAIQAGEADVVIGARSALFAPTPRLGLIVIDEEHENTFKQQNAPRYDAREVARARARFEKAVLVLGSATPSLESYRRALTGRMKLLRLPSRVGGGSFPEMIVADLTQQVSNPGKPRFLSDRLRVTMIEHVSRGGQVILFLNRRGYATAAFCRKCGSAIKCKNCDIVLVYHHKIRRILCHYCGHERRLPERCGDCEGTFRLAGFGTERIEHEVARALPNAVVARMDSDTMKARGAHEEVLSAFREGKIHVLVGTQMIAKGLDFPNVTLVGVVAADTNLNLPDYRAAERTFGLIAQVSGRAGRSEKGGTVIVQTYHPDHFAVRLALRHDYEGFAKIEMEARERDGYPPFGCLARVVIHGKDEQEVRRVSMSLRDQLGEWMADGFTTLLGPAPAPISFINGQHRMHIVAKSRRRSGIHQFTRVVRAWPRPKHQVRILLDVDPLSML
ncbi:MAG: primosomal protein N' [Planctomycetota bacterium]